MNILTIYGSLLQCVKKMLLTIYQTKGRVPGKCSKIRVHLGKVPLAAYKLFKHDFWQSWWTFYDKINLPIRMRIICKVNHSDTIRFKLVDTFLTFPTKLVLEVKTNICSAIKEIILFWLSWVFGICYRYHNLTYFNSKVWILKKTPVLTEINNFAVESFAF